MAGEDAREATAFVARRLIMLLVAGACAFVALLMLCAWLLMLAWDRPWRAGLPGASRSCSAAWRPLSPGRRCAAGQAGMRYSFTRIRGELSRDRELIERAFDGDGQGGNGVEHVPTDGDQRRVFVPTAGERRLAESRAELRALLAPGPDDFPRSQTMRYLMGGKGRMVALGAFAGLLAVKPKLALRLVRFLPLGKLLPIARLIQSLR